MEEIETDFQAASDSLAHLVEGPGFEAAALLEQAFDRASLNIEQALSRAARSGEADFRRMAESILGDLARIAAEAVIAQSSLGQAGQTVNFNLALPGGTAQRPVFGAAGAIANAVALAAAKGARFG